MRPSYEYTRVVSKRQQLGMCLTCQLPECNPDAEACQIRQRVNEIQRDRYHRDTERARASRRKAAIPSEQYEKKLAYMRDYYQRNRQRILARVSEYERKRAAIQAEGA